MNTITLTFDVNGQNIENTSPKLCMASDTVNYVEATFHLGDNWDGFDSVRAVWSNGRDTYATVLDMNGTCKAPTELLTVKSVVKVNLVGSNVVEDELVDRLTTYQSVALNIAKKVPIEGEETDPVTPSQFEQYIAIVGAEVEKVTGMSAEATTLPAGSDATASYEDGVLSFGIPKGDTGATGPKGDPGQDGQDGVGIASVALNSDYTLTITLTDGTTYTTTSIRGEQGIQGPTGPQGATGPQGPQGIQGETGEQGETGLTPDFSIGTVTTLAPGSQATATITGTDEEPVLNLGIPKGDPGDVSSTGYYPELYAGGLVTDKGETDTEPYTFRASKALGYRESLNSIVGGTVAWNQIVNSGDTSVTVQSGHKYYSNINNTKAIGSSNGSAISINDSTKDNVIDLTQMFGSTIADYIYSLEQATAGAGVAWFKKLFPKPYYEYNAGELMSVQASSHDMVGFNQWDEEWEVGNIDSGNPTVANDRIRSKNYIPVVGGATYYTTGRICWYEYDADKNFIKVGNSGSFVENETFTVSNNCAFIKFKCTTAYGTTYKNDICINLSWDGERDGEYEPYIKRSYALDDSLTLRGIPKLDASNNLYFDGDQYEPDGTVTRKMVQVTYDGSADENWTKRTGDANTYFAIKVGANGEVVDGSIICDSYLTAYVTGSNANLGINVINSSGYRGSFIYVRPSDYKTLSVDDFKARLASDPITVVYELATPTTETADPYTQIQFCDPYGTEAFTDYGVASGDRDVAIPVGHSTFYPEDLKGKLEDIPDIPEAPASNGTYVLKAVRSNSGVTYQWVSG